MPYTTRPATAIAAAPNRPADRRERRPLHSVGGHPDIPFFGRADGAPHPVTQARPAPPADAPLGQIIHMAATGVWIVKLNGRITEIGGRMHWSTAQDLAASAEQAGVALSNLVVRTGAIAGA